MRYAQRGGYTPAEQQRRERLRLQAAGRFARGDEISEIAHDLRVTEGSVRRWHRAWRDGGTEALRSKGPVSRERLSPQQWARLELELRKGPLAHGFANDQRWTLGRIKTLIGRLFHVGYTVEGTSKLMRRHGWSAQVPVRQAHGTRRRGGRGVEGRGVARYKSTARDLGAFICFEDEAGQGLRPPKGRTWAPRGARPWSGCAARAAAGSASPGWPATGPGTGRTCSITCWSTAAARARPRGSPGRTTGT